MVNNVDSIYQLKITLNDIEPPIWRHVLVPAIASLADLHGVIQAVMPWEDAHLYQFRKGKLTFSEPDPYNEDVEDSDSAEVLLAELLTAPNQELTYLYDFGDGWEHTILLEEIQPLDLDVIYPQCIGGERACPPEDCGGPPGYAEMLAALKDPEHPEHELYLDWLDDDFDPEWFDLEETNDMLFLELFNDDEMQAPAPINRHLVVMTPTQAYFDLRSRLSDAGIDVFEQGEPFPLAFLVPITPSSSDLEDELESMMPMFITMQMLMESFDPEIVAQIAEEELADLFTFQVIPMVFDLDTQFPLIHFTPDLFDEDFEDFEEDEL